jgi:nucleoside permease NupC
VTIEKSRLTDLLTEEFKKKVFLDTKSGLEEKKLSLTMYIFNLFMFVLCLFIYVCYFCMLLLYIDIIPWLIGGRS